MKHLISIALMLLSFIAYSQDTKTGGFVAALEYPTKTGTLTDGTKQDFDLSYRVGYNFAETYNDLWKRHTEITSSYKSYKFDIDGEGVKVQSVSFDLGLNFRRKINFRGRYLFGIGGGALFGVNLLEKQTGLETPNLTNQVRTNFAAVALVNREFRRFDIEVRYSKGIINQVGGTETLRGNNLGVYFFGKF